MNILNKRLEIIDILAYFIMLIPIWWILGIKFFVFQILSFYIILKVFNKECFKDKNLKNIIIGVSIYAISTFIALLQNPLKANGFDLLSPLYLLSYWIMGMFIIIGINCIKISKEQFTKVLKAFFIIGIVCIGLLIVGSIMWSNNENIYNSNGLLYSILPKSLKINFFELFFR